MLGKFLSDAVHMRGSVQLHRIISEAFEVVPGDAGAQLVHQGAIFGPAGYLMPAEVSTLQATLMRGFDVVASMLLLLLLCPLLLLIGVLVRCDSGGTVLYRQERLGLYGKPFTLVKFRSMRSDAEAAGPAWASVGDTRTTRVGRVLRLTRLDELPQLWNVLKGDMALVGPRPERAHFAEKLTEHIPQFPARLLVKPGVTGWAQVNLPYGTSIEDARAKLAYDLEFIRNQGFSMTAIVLIRTVGIMASASGR